MSRRVSQFERTPLSRQPVNGARLLQAARRLIRDRDGTAAIEFALIGMLMISMYLGLSEAAMAIMHDRATSHSAAVVGDLTTQLSSVDEAQLEDILTAGVRVLTIPIRDKNRIDDVLEMDVFSFVRDPDTNDITPIGYAHMGSGTKLTKSNFDPEDIDPRLLNTNSGVIVSRISYHYRPVTGWFFPDELFLQEDFIFKPRVPNQINFDNGPTSDEFSCDVNSSLVVNCS